MKHQRNETSIVHVANENCMHYFEVYITRTDGQIM